MKAVEDGNRWQRSLSDLAEYIKWICISSQRIWEKDGLPIIRIGTGCKNPNAGKDYLSEGETIILGKKDIIDNRDLFFKRHHYIFGYGKMDGRLLNRATLLKS